MKKKKNKKERNGKKKIKREKENTEKHMPYAVYFRTLCIQSLYRI